MVVVQEGSGSSLVGMVIFPYSDIKILMGELPSENDTTLPLRENTT